jgi:hypothetical protein
VRTDEELRSARRGLFDTFPHEPSAADVLRFQKLLGVRVHGNYPSAAEASADAKFCALADHEQERQREDANAKPGAGIPRVCGALPLARVSSHQSIPPRRGRHPPGSGLEISIYSDPIDTTIDTRVCQSRCSTGTKKKRIAA